MGSWCTTPDPTPAAPTIVNQQADPLFRDSFAKVFSKANNVAERHYQTYGQPRIADLTPDTLASFNMTRNNAGTFQPYLNEAAGQAQTAGLSLPQRNLSDYMNPYTQNVVDIAKREAIRGDDIARQNRNYTAQKAGAFGGSRQAIVEAEAGRNLGQRLDDIQAQGMNSAYDKALTAINNESTNQSRSAAVLGDLGQKQSTLGAADASAVDAIGTRQQQQNQAGLTQMYNDFLAQRDWDKDQASYLSGILSGAPQAAASRTTETTNFTPQASPISQGAGLATTGLGLYGLGKFAGLFAEGGRVGFAGGEDVRAYANMSDQELWQEALKYKDTDPPKYQQLRNLLSSRVTRTQRQPQAVNLGSMRNEGDRAAPGANVGNGRTWRDDSPNNDPAEGINGPPTPPKGPASLANISLLSPNFDGVAPQGQEQNPQRTIPQAPSLADPGQFRAPKMGPMSDLEAAATEAAGMQTPAQARTKIAAKDPTLMKGDETPAWIMPVLRAGLAMMQAKPGQSALAGIGAGGDAGLTQATQDRAERRVVDIENQRRRERAEDVTHREQESAARDAQTAIENKYRQIGVKAQKNQLTLEEFKANLDAAVKARTLSNDQARLALEGYRANLEGVKTGLEGERVDIARKQEKAYGQYLTRPTQVGVSEEGDVVTQTPDGKTQVQKGVKNPGYEAKTGAAYQKAFTDATKAALELEFTKSGLMPGQTPNAAQRKRIDDARGIDGIVA